LHSSESVNQVKSYEESQEQESTRERENLRAGPRQGNQGQVGIAEELEIIAAMGTRTCGQTPLQEYTIWTGPSVDHTCLKNTF